MLRGISSGLVLVALALSVGTAKAAEPVVGSTHDDPYPSPGELSVKGSHGYGIRISADRPAHGQFGQVRIKAEDSRAEVEYAAPANLAGEGFHANLGPFGRIDLRWVPNGRPRELSASCRGRTTNYFIAAGAYVGTLSFRGGDAFTVAKARRIAWPYRWRRHVDGCRREGGETVPGPGALLEAATGRQHPEASRYFSAYQPKPGVRVQYSASDEERLGRIEIHRSTVAFGRPTTLSFEPNFATAEIAPPAPFSGSARFERVKGGRDTWLGNLSVDFPDGSVVPMAGEAFDATFHSALLEGLSR